MPGCRIPFLYRQQVNWGEFNGRGSHTSEGHLRALSVGTPQPALVTVKLCRIYKENSTGAD